MTSERTDRDLDAALGAWMHDVAPAAVPVPVLEEAFARTMTVPQARVYPWLRVTRRSSRSRGLTQLSLVATAALFVGVLALGALGAGFGGGPAPSPTPSTTAVPASASASASLSVSIPIVPTASVAVVGPMSLATDGKVVWALTGTGLVRRIDPVTNAVGAGVQTGATSDAYQGMSVDGNGVWVTDSTTMMLYRVDPLALKVAATIKVGLAPKGVLAAGSAVWVADTHSGTVLRVDPTSNKIVATVTVGPTGPSGPNWLASGLGSIWVGVPNASMVVRIDPVTNAIQARIAIPVEASPCGGFAITPVAVWITGCDGPRTIARIDPATNTVVGTVAINGHAQMPAVIGGVPWVSLDTSPSAPGSLVRVASATNAVDLELSPGVDFGGGGDLVVAAGSAWVIDGGQDRVLRLPLSGFSPG